MTDENISRVSTILPLLELMSQLRSPFLLIASDLVGAALSTVLVNKLRGNVDGVAVKTPGFGLYSHSTMQDISILASALFFT